MINRNQDSLDSPQRGVSLVEVVIALAVFTMIALAVSMTLMRGIDHREQAFQMYRALNAVRNVVSDIQEIANQPHVSKVVDLVAKFFSGRKDWPSVRERIVSEVAERELRNLRIERSDRKVIDVAAIPLPDGGRLYKYTDVTDSINMERALRERNEALMAADRLKSEFIANVSYEFRTPLTSLRMAIHLCAEGVVGPITEKQADLLYAAREDCERWGYGSCQ